MPPRVSVCVPVHNGARHLEEALRSALAQTYSDYELLVVDDASTDGSPEIVRGFTDPRIRLRLNPTALGMPANWNECLSQARGEYVKFLFQDDVLFPSAVEALVGALDRFPEAPLAFGRRELWVESGEDILGAAYREALDAFYRSIKETVRGLDLVTTALADGRDLTLNVVGEPSFVLLRRRATLSAGGFDAGFSQLADWEAWLRLARQGPLVFVDECLGRFRIHTGSESTANFRTLAIRREMVRLLARVGQLYGAGLRSAAWRALQREQWRYRLRLAAAQVLRR